MRFSLNFVIQLVTQLVTRFCHHHFYTNSQLNAFSWPVLLKHKKQVRILSSRQQGTSASEYESHVLSGQCVLMRWNETRWLCSDGPHCKPMISNIHVIIYYTYMLTYYRGLCESKSWFSFLDRKSSSIWFTLATSVYPNFQQNCWLMVLKCLNR